MSVERAAALREQGLTFAEVGERLGVSRSTIFRWLNPNYAEQQRRSSREAKRRRQEPCEDCGRLKAYDNDGPRCQGCETAHTYGARNERIFAAWEEGEPAWYIAEREGMTATAVQTLVDNHRQNGRPLSLHRRRNREAWSELIRLRKAGLTNPEIGGRLDMNTANVAFMFKAMSEAGENVPRSPYLERAEERARRKMAA